MNTDTANKDVYNSIKERLKNEPKNWLITGVAGFIGSNLLETLLMLNQNVVGLDNFSTGHRKNIADVKSMVSSAQWQNFVLIEGDIRNFADCKIACLDVHHVLHQAALGSVPRSIENPVDTNDTNISGFLNMLLAGRDANVASFTYAASSSTYGDHPSLPKIESLIGKPLSPYAVTKYVNELYAEVFFRTYGFKTTGLRYFNVFGKRQDPDGAYAAVIPKWIDAMLEKKEIYINGDGTTSRDFCYIENAVQANILAATSDSELKNSQIYNVAFGARTDLLELHKLIRENLINLYPTIQIKEPVYRNERIGDVKHSQADIEKIKTILGYSPQFSLRDGLRECVRWYAISKS